jgi:hypothetical protein
MDAIEALAKTIYDTYRAKYHRMNMPWEEVSSKGSWLVQAQAALRYLGFANSAGEVYCPEADWRENVEAALARAQERLSPSNDPATLRMTEYALRALRGEE